MTLPVTVACASCRWGRRRVQPAFASLGAHPGRGRGGGLEDELERIVEDVPVELAGLCLAAGHLDYSGMDPVKIIVARRIRFFDASAEGVMAVPPAETGYPG